MPSLLIAFGLLLLSTLAVNHVKERVLLGKGAARVVLACAVLVLIVGFTLHLRAPVPAPRAHVAMPPGRGAVAAGWTFSFRPRSVKWGQEVEIRVTPPRKDVTVYYNERPLPARPKGEGIFVVTMPSMSKSGYFTLDSAGSKVRAVDELIVSAY